MTPGEGFGLPVIESGVPWCGDVLVLTPTRERPDEARRLYDNVLSTAHGRTGVVFGVDDDDRSYDGITDLPIVRGPRKGLAAWTNELAFRFGTGRYRGLASFGDDHVPLTPGWDLRLLAALDVIGGGIAYGDDLAMRQRLPTAPVISSEIVAGLGWMCEPAIRHQFTDNVWLLLGQAARCLVYVPQVVIEHRHWSAGKAPSDDVYRHGFSSWAADETAFNDWRVTASHRDARTVRAILDSTTM